MTARTLTAHATLDVQHPKALLAQLCEHLNEYDGVDYKHQDGRHQLISPFGNAEMCERDNGFDVSVSASTLPAILDMRSIIAHHVIEFAGESIQIRWSGDGAQIRKPLNYRVLTVEAVEELTPRMRRIRFSVENIAAFATQAHIHVRLIFSQKETVLSGPEIGENGLERWPNDQPKPDSRAYTLRRIDAIAGTIEIDFVLHAEADGPGCRFALQAQRGQHIGMTGPGGASLPLDRDWYLIAGDETALPAIARFMEMLPPFARGHVVIETASVEERLELQPPDSMTIDWVLRSDGLTSVACHYHPPADAVSPFVWVGCEENQFRQLREYVRKDLGLQKGSHLIVAYWHDCH